MDNISEYKSEIITKLEEIFFTLGLDPTAETNKKVKDIGELLWKSKIEMLEDHIFLIDTIFKNHSSSFSKGGLAMKDMLSRSVQREKNKLEILKLL